MKWLWICRGQKALQNGLGLGRFAARDFAHGPKKCAFFVDFRFFEEEMTESHINNLKIAKF
jgi:hypothetical protein